MQLMGACAPIGQIPLQSVPIIKLDEKEKDDTKNERLKCDETAREVCEGGECLSTSGLSGECLL